MKLSSFGRILLIGTLSLVSMLQASGQSTPSTAQPASKKSLSTEAAANQVKKKQTAGPFHGRLKAIDLGARTITMGTRTFHADASTKIIKQAKPATLKDGVIGEPVSGYFQASEDGRLVLRTLRFGPKTPEEENAKKTATPRR